MASLYNVKLLSNALPLEISDAVVESASAAPAAQITGQEVPSSAGWNWCLLETSIVVFKLGSSNKTEKAYSFPYADSSSADLCCYVPHNGFCVVSKKGSILYWPSISIPNMYVESSLNLDPNINAEQIVLMRYDVCIVATNSVNLLYLIELIPTQRQIVIHRLARTDGMLSALGKRMTSFFAYPETHLDGLNAALKLDDTALLLLTNFSLALYRIHSPSNYNQTFCWDIADELRASLHGRLWPNEAYDPMSLSVGLLDLGSHDRGIFLLASVTNTSHSDKTVKLCLALLNLKTSPPSFVEITPLQLSLHSEDSDQRYRLLIPSLNAISGFVFNTSVVYAVTMVDTGGSVERIQFSPHYDRIYGAGSDAYALGGALFLSVRHGLVSVIPKEAEELYKVQMSVAKDAMAIELASSESEKDSPQEILKSAFLLHVQKKISHSNSVLDELYERLSASTETIDNVVVNFSRLLLDDVPDSDPRWSDTDSCQQNQSLLLDEQITSKARVLFYYLKFLDQSKVLTKLSPNPSVNWGGQVVPAYAALLEHKEIVEAVKVVREFQQSNSNYESLISDLLRNIPSLRQISSKSIALTCNDIFFTRLSNFNQMFPVIEQWLDSYSTDGPVFVKECLVPANELVLKIVTAIQKQRSSCRDLSRDILRFMWTASETGSFLCSLLRKLHGLNSSSLSISLPSTQSSVTEKHAPLDHYISRLADCFLSFQAPVSLKNDAVYERQRTEMIKPLVSAKQYDTAASLAEKYLDFGILIEICELTNDSEKLDGYIRHFDNQGFPEFMYNWFMDKGRPGKVLSQPALLNNEKFSKFMEHEGSKQFAWLHHIGTKEYGKAHKCLESLANEEEESLARKRTLIALSKLSALVSPEFSSNELQKKLSKLDIDMQLIWYQEQLPSELLENYGISPDAMPVLTPEELCKLYICETNESATELDFLRALEIMTTFCPDEVKAGMRLLIWTSAILKDSWDDIDLSNPVIGSQHTMMFRLAQTVRDHGYSLLEMLPPEIDLMSSDLLREDLRSMESFQFLMKLCYEHARKYQMTPKISG